MNRYRLQAVATVGLAAGVLSHNAGCARAHRSVEPERG
jgi:putative effector of murein hydrolase